MKLMRTPRTVDLEITSRCNARCRYCYYMNNEGVVYRDLPTAAWLALFDELGRAKIISVCLAGGEPFLREDLFDLIEGIVKNRMRFEVLTNGSLVSREAARRLAATGRCNHVQVSLDGSRAETHELMRGEGSFEPAINVIRVLLEEGVSVTVRVTVHAGNIDDLPATAHLLLEELGLPGFSTNSISPLGTRSKYADDLFLTPTQRLRAMHVLAALDEQYPGRISASAGPLAEWKGFHAMEQARKSDRPIPGRGRLVGCGCAFSKLSVRSDGAYVPCNMLPQMVLGAIGKDSLEDIWRNSSMLNEFRRRRDIPLNTFDECRDCPHELSCTGGCAGTAFSLLRDPNHPSPDACLRNFENHLAVDGRSLWC